MTINEALNLNAKTASNKQLQQAVMRLKSSFHRSANAIAQLGYETELMKTVGARIETEPIYSKSTLKLNREELQEVFSTYREAKGHRIVDRGKVIGWEENLTSTKTGFLKNQKNIAKNILGFKGYTKLTQEQQKNLWEIIDDVRSAREGYFKPGSGVYGSSENLKKITSWINQGITDRNELIRKLEGKTTQEKAAEQDAISSIVPLSPMDLLPSQEDF